MSQRTDYEGNKRWYDSKGEYHRDDGPACENINGDKFWFKHGKFHREDGPAVELHDGQKNWYINDIWIL
jgi:hypothetical protein